MIITLWLKFNFIFNCQNLSYNKNKKADYFQVGFNFTVSIILFTLTEPFSL